jgi:hypothetical protein
MAALLRQGARRIGGSVLQRTQAAVTSPAVAEERRRLVSRRAYSTEEVSEPKFTSFTPHDFRLVVLLCKYLARSRIEPTIIEFFTVNMCYFLI